MTVWRALRKRLEMKPYRLHLVQFLQSFWYKVYYFVCVGKANVSLAYFSHFAKNKK
jgi:hypothetical protein